jgi:high-affinity Fe2+/Pb2+ permease
MKRMTVIALLWGLVGFFAGLLAVGYRAGIVEYTFLTALNVGAMFALIGATIGAAAAIVSALKDLRLAVSMTLAEYPAQRPSHAPPEHSDPAIRANKPA